LTDDAGTLIDALRARLAELDDLGRVGGLLGWDQQTMMPPGGGPARGEAMATLERITHERATDPALGELLAELADGGGGGGDHEAALVRVARRDYDRARRVPTELAGEMALAASEAQPAWLEARERNDFAIFAPFLERNVELRKRYADCFPESEHPYDALLDRFEPDATTAQIRDVFARLSTGLVPLIEVIAAGPAPPELPGPFAIEAQRELALELARAIGYADDAWRMDDAVHPFASSVARTDIRVTTRFASDSLTGLFATMHEVGHGLYEHATDPALDRTTLGTGVSMGIHESQSRLWENCVGRSLTWWRHWYPRAQDLFPDALGDFPLEYFHRAINVVRPTLIRVEADEATYSLHVILRFELELALIEGTVAIVDLPEAWNARMKELLGVDVPDDRQGVLQDIHWAFGELGYFPTYALGNVVAAQLWKAAREALPDLDDRLAAGDCAPLRDWLRENVHRHGRALMPAEIIERATGGPLDPQPFLDYLEAKYRPLYRL
jgi:carboxypeptidase Taq